MKNAREALLFASDKTNSTLCSLASTLWSFSLYHISALSIYFVVHYSEHLYDVSSVLPSRLLRLSAALYKAKDKIPCSERSKSRFDANSQRYQTLDSWTQGPEGDCLIVTSQNCASQDASFEFEPNSGCMQCPSMVCTLGYFYSIFTGDL